MTPDFTSATEPRAYAIYEHYGFPHQTLKLAEEAGELAAAAARYHDHTSDLGDDMLWLRPLAEECADVLVLISQLCTDMPFEELVREAFAEKLDRQIARVRAENSSDEKTLEDTLKSPVAIDPAAFWGTFSVIGGITDASAKVYAEGGTR